MGFYAVRILKYELHRTREKHIGWEKKRSIFKQVNPSTFIAHGPLAQVVG